MTQDDASAPRGRRTSVEVVRVSARAHDLIVPLENACAAIGASRDRDEVDTLYGVLALCRESLYRYVEMLEARDLGIARTRVKRF